MAGRSLAVPLDARFTHRGTYSSWLSKAKGDDSKVKWLSGTSRRYFTIDFDNQVFFYSRTESGRKDASPPISFSDIVMAEQAAEERLFSPASRTSTSSRQPGPQPPPTVKLAAAAGAPLQTIAARMASKLSAAMEDSAPHAGGLRRSLSLTSMMSRRSAGSSSEFPLFLHTRDRRIKLLAERECDARDWVDLLNAASRVGQGLSTEHRPGAKAESSWPPDYSLLPQSMQVRLSGDGAGKSVPNWNSEKQEPSEKCSQEASTAEGASECGSASPAGSSCAGEDGSSSLLKEPPACEDTESTACSGTSPERSIGLPSPAQQFGGTLGQEQSDEVPPLPQIAWQEAKPWEAPPMEPRRLQAADFGFDDEDLEDEEDEEASPESSPCRRSPAVTRASGAPEALLGAAADQGSIGAIGSTVGAGAQARVEPAVAEELDDGDGSDDEVVANSGVQQASRVAADLQLMARALAPRLSGSASSGSCAATSSGEKRKKSKAGKHTEQKPQEAGKHTEQKPQEASKHSEPTSEASRPSESKSPEAEDARRIAADLMLVQRAQAAAAHRHGSKAARAPGRSPGSSVPVSEAS